MNQPRTAYANLFTNQTSSFLQEVFSLNGLGKTNPAHLSHDMAYLSIISGIWSP